MLAATALFGSLQRPDRRRRSRRPAAPWATRSAWSNPNNVVGAILGAAVVFLFSGLAISAVARAAGRVVFEVREQFRTHPGIMDLQRAPRLRAVVDICTKDSLRELATPGLLAIFAPVAVGFLLGVGPLAAYLVGAIAAGVLMAVFLANSGGAWDNAKKMVEDGAYGGKGSEAHAATVIGDTVGDPFKDTAGPAINPLIKVMNLVAVLIAPAVVSMSGGSGRNTASGSLIALVAVLVIVGAVVVSKRRAVVAGGAPSDTPTQSVHRGPDLHDGSSGRPPPAGGSRRRCGQRSDLWTTRAVPAWAAPNVRASRFPTLAGSTPGGLPCPRPISVSLRRRRRARRRARRPRRAARRGVSRSAAPPAASPADRRSAATSAGARGAAATAWGTRSPGCSPRSAPAMAGTLHAAVASYRALDGELAQAVLPGGAAGIPVPR